VLPEHKSDAMCAVYAFMRRADDLADDESLSIPERRQAMSAWVAEWREARRSGITTDPVFLALNDTQKRFAIPDALLEDLVQGTTMDLEQPIAAGEIQTFNTFDDLYRYCYLVASVVGLVCIRIFGYTDPRAEKLAEETGIAFQLTNILRDVKEDAERGRIYLPQQMLHASGMNTERVIALANGARIEPADRVLLRQLGDKAEAYYASAEKLLPLIDKDSRAALWVLVAIYHKLLLKIGESNYDVFSQRVSVPTPSKLLTLGQGMAMAAFNRVTS
jgi:phytoene synthase